jgi:hypothetical protein
MATAVKKGITKKEGRTWEESEDETVWEDRGRWRHMVVI